jgi:hypothetical protein
MIEDLIIKLILHEQLLIICGSKHPYTNIKASGAAGDISWPTSLLRQANNTYQMMKA